MSRPKHRSPSRTSCAISTSARWCGSRLRTLIRKSKREPSHACKACKAPHACKACKACKVSQACKACKASHACKACKASHACKAAVIPPVLLRHSLLPRGGLFPVLSGYSHFCVTDPPPMFWLHSHSLYSYRCVCYHSFSRAIRHVFHDRFVQVSFSTTVLFPRGVAFLVACHSLSAFTKKPLTR